MSPVARQQKQRYNRPHLSLRWLASYQTLGVFLGAYLLLYTWVGVGPVTFLVLLLLAVVMYAVTKALFLPHQKPKQS